MAKWSSKDKESGLVFGIEVAESGKLFLNCSYNGIEVNPRWYEFTQTGLDALELLINTVRADLKKVKKPKTPKNMEKRDGRRKRVPRL